MTDDPEEPVGRTHFHGRQDGEELIMQVALAACIDATWPNAFEVFEGPREGHAMLALGGVAAVKRELEGGVMEDMPLTLGTFRGFVLNRSIGLSVCAHLMDALGISEEELRNAPRKSTFRKPVDG